jgi:hypothetical protein
VEAIWDIYIYIYIYIYLYIIPFQFVCKLGFIIDQSFWNVTLPDNLCLRDPFYHKARTRGPLAVRGPQFEKRCTREYSNEIKILTRPQNCFFFSANKLQRSVTDGDDDNNNNNNTWRQKCDQARSWDNLKHKDLITEIQRMKNGKSKMMPVMTGATVIISQYSDSTWATYRGSTKLMNCN